jgi:hypothetical protein
VSVATEEVTGLRNERKPCHFWVDNEVADCYQPIVGADAIWVYCRIARNAHGAWIVSPKVRAGDTRVSLREMAEWCGKSVDTVSRCLQVLEHVGLLRAVRGAKAKGRYALADVKDLVMSEGGLYDREMGSFQLPAERVAELKRQVCELRLKLARKNGVQLAVVGGRKEAAASVAQSDRLDCGLFAAPVAQSDSSVALDVQNCRSERTASINTKLNKAKLTTPPKPPQAGAEGLRNAAYDRAADQVCIALGIEENQRRKRRMIAGAVRCACEKGDPAPTVALGIIAAVREQDELHLRGEVKFKFGLQKFLGEGIWRDHNRWAWDPAEMRRQGNASVGSVR